MRRLRGAGYYVGIVVLIAHITELIIATWPARIHSPSWRITFVGGTANTVFMTLLVVFLMTAIAVMARDRRTTFALAGLSGLAAVAFFVMSGLFALDALQMRNEVRQALAARYDFASAWVLARELIAAIGFLVLTVTAFRSARAMKPESTRSAAKGGDLVVGGLTPPRAEKPAGAPGT